MKLLMILDGVDYPNAVNPRLAYRLASELTGMGHTVHILYMAGFEQDLPAAPQGVEVFPLLFPHEARMEQILEHGAPGGTPVVRRLLRLLAHPGCYLPAIQRILLHHPGRIDCCRRNIELYCARNCYDAVLTVNAPYHSAEALMNASIGARRLVWQMDPLSDNPSSQGPDAAQLEFALCQKADLLFITPEMERRLNVPGNPLVSYRRKMAVLDFPALVPQPVQAKAAAPDTSPLKVVFAGSFYKDLRTPHFALQLFAALNDPDVQLILVGGGWENYAPELPAPAQETLGKRLIITGQLSPEEASLHLQDADVLLNLGNSTDIQLPSKIFEYFSMGKPVLTLAKSTTDPALSYLNRYPLSCIIQEEETVCETTLNRLRTFLHQTRAKRCSQQEILRLFEANTPTAVAQSFLNSLKRLI